jgi:hypothetical protein
MERQKQAALPAQPVPQPPPPQSKSLPAASQDQNCALDQQRLAQLRADPALDEIARFERELGCEKLRPQVVRLRESLGGADAHPQAVAVAPPTEPPPVQHEPPRQPAIEPEQAKPSLGQQGPGAAMTASASASSPQGDEACKRDEERLMHLRGNPTPEDIARFERELGCAKLRPQIARLRESLGIAVPARQPPVAPSDSKGRGAMLPDGTLPPATSSRGISPAASSPALSADEICKRDEERLARLRSNPLADEIARFERELGCVKLRPQIARLRESVGAN